MDHIIQHSNACCTEWQATEVRQLLWPGGTSTPQINSQRLGHKLLDCQQKFPLSLVNVLQQFLLNFLIMICSIESGMLQVRRQCHKLARQSQCVMERLPRALVTTSSAIRCALGLMVTNGQERLATIARGLIQIHTQRNTDRTLLWKGREEGSANLPAIHTTGKSCPMTCPSRMSAAIRGVHSDGSSGSAATSRRRSASYMSPERPLGGYGTIPVQTNFLPILLIIPLLVALSSGSVWIGLPERI